jgi:hypothetical protein
MAKPPGMAMGIDFGEITTGLSGIMGIGKGLAGQKNMRRATKKMAQLSTHEFGIFADKAAAAGEVSHMYEYGQPNASGRLWYLTWNQQGVGRTGHLMTRPSKVPTRIDPVISASAAAAGRQVAQHLFPSKAIHMETRKTLFAVAGVQQYTTRVGAGASQVPRSLVYVDKNGNVKFARSRRWENQFYGKFTALFIKYWMDELERKSSKRMQSAFIATVKRGSQHVNAGVRTARMMSTPRITPGMRGLVLTDRGRPYAGIRLRENEVNRIANKVGKKLEKEMVSKWR